MRYLVILLLFSTSLTAQSIFLEKDGIVRVDMESGTSAADNFGQWEVHDSIPGFIGDGYLEFRGPDFFNNPGNSTLTYKVRISKTGTYLFRWHSRITEANETTEFNDSWLRSPDASSFFAREGSRVIYPKGSGRTPNPEGSGRDGWFKAYQNRANAWNWRVSTSDRDPHDIFMTFDAPGDYTVEISGRSFGHAIDRWVLVHSDASRAEAESLTAPESERVTTSVTTRDTGQLEVSPNPVSDYLSIAIPADVRSGTYQLDIHDATGRIARSQTAELRPGANFQLATSELAPGSYVLTIQAGGRVFTARFLK